MLNNYLRKLIDSLYLNPIERHLFGHKSTFQWFWNWWKQWDWSVVGRIKHLGRLLVKLRDCRVQKLVLAPSFKNLLRKPSYPRSFRALSICHYFQDFFLRSVVQAKNIWSHKTRRVSTDCKLNLSGGFGSLISRESVKFEKKSLKILEIERVS